MMSSMYLFAICNGVKARGDSFYLHRACRKSFGEVRTRELVAATIGRLTPMRRQVGSRTHGQGDPMRLREGDRTMASMFLLGRHLQPGHHP
jgi:hypothetical protein